VNSSAASPGPSALCELSVRLKNGGAHAASNFIFSVRIDGQDVPLYKARAYVVNIEPGQAAELRLDNFYSPPAPKTFEVQVSLVQAQWVQVTKEGNNTTTAPTGPVAGLPATASLSVKMPAPPARHPS
jgi:hypothetical protein